MRKLAATLFSALIALTAAAHPVGADQARQAAQHFWQHTLHQRGQVSQVQWAYKSIHLFAAPQGGYVLLAADDAVRPLLGYSTQSTLDPQNLPIQLAEMLDAMQERIEAASRQGVVPAARDHAMWQRLMAGTPMKDGSTEVEPLLETQWDQSPYYNRFCPENTVAGCAAICQAQVMRYWRWPSVGVGSHKYNSYMHGTLSADFGHTVYDWDQMPAQLTGLSSQTEINTTATLIYHVGVSMEMNYNSAYNGGSGAYGFVGSANVPSIENSFKDFFRYNKNLIPVFKYEYSDSAWAAILIDELDKHHPLPYCGTSTAGGHAFVCDGYELRDDAPYFHFNFGWSGTGDGYYTVDDISPNVSPTGEVGTVYTFNQNNSTAIGVVPDYSLVVSDTRFNIPVNGGTFQLYASGQPNHPDSDFQLVGGDGFITLGNTDFVNDPLVTFSVDTNHTGQARFAYLRFRQGSDTITVSVIQSGYTDDQLCPLTVEMVSTRGKGWRGGAHLSFEDEYGFTLATTTMDDGSNAAVTVKVPHHYLDVVFHSGGPTDREINYRVKNQLGEVLVDVEYAYHNGGTHHIEWPCVSVAVEPVDGPTLSLAPNPVSDRFTVSGLQSGEQVVLYDILGNELSRHAAQGDNLTIDASSLPAGLYIVRCREAALKLVKQ